MKLVRIHLDFKSPSTLRGRLLGLLVGLLGLGFLLLLVFGIWVAFVLGVALIAAGAVLRVCLPKLRYISSSGSRFHSVMTKSVHEGDARSPIPPLRLTQADAQVVSPAKPSPTTDVSSINGKNAESQ